MNDEELNELIARSDQESVIFREMDIQREREAQESWRLSGNRGKPPQPLMQLEELPECYQMDEPFEVKEVDDLVEGRGQRRRNVVSYNDGLSDDAWALVCIFITIHLLLPLTSLLFFLFPFPFFFRPWKKEKTCRSFLNVRGTKRIVGAQVNLRKTTISLRVVPRPQTTFGTERTIKKGKRSRVTTKQVCQRAPSESAAQNPPRLLLQ